MFSLEVDYLVSQEKYKDRRRDVERQQLIQIATLRQPDKRGSLRRMVGWISSRLVTWDSVLLGRQTLTQRG